eukprot:1290172-Amphidinium_carterae.1
MARFPSSRSSQIHKARHDRMFMSLQQTWVMELVTVWSHVQHRLTEEGFFFVARAKTSRNTMQTYRKKIPAPPGNAFKLLCCLSDQEPLRQANSNTTSGRNKS